MKTTFRTRSLGGSLLVIKDLNDCLTIERDKNSKPCVVSIEGQWNQGEIKEAIKEWWGSEAERR